MMSADLLLARKVDKIFIMLGSSCNLKCSYCVQGTGCSVLPTSPKPCLFNFLERAAENIAPETLTIVFYGGEPLLYLKQIKEIISRTKHLNVEYTTITNGKLLDEQAVEYFNEQKVNVAVSWDGKKSMVTRGYDVISDKKEILMKLDGFGLSGVLSGETMVSTLLDDFQSVDDEYFQKRGRHIKVNIAELIVNGCMPDNLTNIDCLAVANDVAGMIHEVMSKKEKPYVKEEYINEQFGTLLYKKPFSGGISKCRNGTFTLNVDLDGNLYTCHNVHEPIGHVDGDYAEYYKKLVQGSESLKYVDVCMNCYVKDLCRGGCKLVTKESRENGFCELRSALFTPFVDFFNQIIIPKIKEV